MAKKSKKTASPEELAAQRGKFEDYLQYMDDSLEALIAFAKSLNRPELLPLDYTFESLDRLEHLYELVLSGDAKPDVSEDKFRTRLATYLGETRRKNLGGKWKLEEDPDLATYGLPGLGEMPGFKPEFLMTPLLPVKNFAGSRKKGQFRDFAEYRM